MKNINDECDQFFIQSINKAYEIQTKACDLQTHISMKKVLKKLLFKTRSFLIKLLARNDMTIAINVEFDGKKGFIIRKVQNEYLVIKNMDISNCDTGIYIESNIKDVTIDYKELKVK